VGPGSRALAQEATQEAHTGIQVSRPVEAQFRKGERHRGRVKENKYQRPVRRRTSESRLEGAPEHQNPGQLFCMSYLKKFHLVIYLLFQTTYKQQQPIRILSRQTKKGA
jgi:hypothetical protein